MTTNKAMFKKSKKGYYFWEEIAKLGFIHGFSTRKFGDMNIKNPKSNNHLKIFLKSLGIGNKDVVRMDQIHGSNVEIVDYRDSGLARITTVGNTDGFVSLSNVCLVVTIADCVPALFLDKNKKFFGIAHAGWKGVYSEIVNKMVKSMVKKGSKLTDIMVGIGPSIRVCCYNVNKDRVGLFRNKFPKMKAVIKIKDSKIFLDLVKIVKFQLKGCGILDRNILDSKLCTKDNHLDFYSFRKEGGTESFGLSCGMIGRL